MNDVVFENLLCDAAAQLREERLEKIKLPHKNRHILRAFAVCVCAAILSLAVVYAVPSMRAQLFSLLQIEEESDWILRFESQTQTEPITTLPEFTPNWLPEDTVRTKFNSSEGHILISSIPIWGDCKFFGYRNIPCTGYPIVSPKRGFPLGNGRNNDKHSHILLP